MASKVRWEDTSVRIFVDGVEFGPYSCTSFTADSQMQSDSNKYQGRTTPSMDSTYMGERGTIEFRLDDEYADPREAFDAFKNPVIERAPGGRVMIVAARRKPGGTAREARRYENCQLNYSERGAENQPTSGTLNWEAERGESI